MLFRRSLMQELASNMVGAFLILFGIIIAQRTGFLIKMAANGDLPNDAILVILGFTMIRFLPMLLTVSVFLAILMTLSRWYRDSEMIIWLSAGLSIKNLLRPVFLFTLPIVLVIMVLSLFITPWSIQKIDDFRVQLESRDEFAAIAPGVFKESSRGERMFFVESFDKLGQIVKNVFVQSVQHQKLGIIVAAQGHRDHAKNGDNFLVMENGRRYQGKPNTPEFSVTTFDEYGIRMEPNEVIKKPPSAKSASSMTLIEDNSKSNIAELEWRFAFPISALILAMFAIPLSAIDPRAGKTANFILAIFIYVVYNNLLSIAQAWIVKGKIHPVIGLWPVHVLFLMIGIYFFKRILDQKPLLPRILPKRQLLPAGIKTTLPVKVNKR